MNINLPATPAAYSKSWADALTTAVKNAFGQVDASGASISFPYGATITLTDKTGKRWALSVDTTGALVLTPV